mmetsp:Transcript_35318/g.51569  ORF Transcript_35318/g.51569 Transcript_35318/m.51569 type:complete len:170 (+) Transcript_35318:149-658(+)
MSSQMNMIHQAICDGNDEALKVILTENKATSQNLQKPDKTGNTAVHLACMLNKPNALRLLHIHGKVELDQPCDATQFGSALFYATHYSRPELLSTLWCMGYNLEGPCDKYGNAPVYYARLKEDERMIQLLTELRRRGSVRDFMMTKIISLVRGYLTRKKSILREKEEAK